MTSQRRNAARYATIATAALCVSCGGAPQPTPPSVRSRPTSATETESNAAPAPTALRTDATFRELVGAESRRPPQGANAATCSIRNDNGRISLETDWLPAVTPLVLADSPAGPLREPSALMLLTRWGASGTLLPGTTVVVGIDGTQPRRDSAVLLLGKSGDTPLYSGADLVLHGPQSNFDANDLVYVAVYGDTKLSTLLQLLESLEHAGIKTALAAILPADTAIPAPDPRTQRAGMCEREAAPDSDDADHDMTLLTEALRARREALSDCVRAHPTHFQEGGLMQVALTLGEQGTVITGCVAEDTTDAPALRQCVLERYRDVFTRASRGQITVNVEVPFGASPGDTTVMCPPGRIGDPPTR